MLGRDRDRPDNRTHQHDGGGCQQQRPAPPAPLTVSLVVGSVSPPPRSLCPPRDSAPEFRRSARGRGGGRHLRVLVVLLELAQDLVTLSVVDRRSIGREIPLID
jgi:hypothetical protein